MPARSACSALPPLLHGPMPPWPHGSWRHGPQCLHASTPGPMAPWSPGPMPLDQMPFKGLQRMPAHSARSACSALPPLQPPSMTANPLLFVAPGPLGPMVPWPYAPRPNQKTLKGPVHARPLRPLRLLRPSPAPPWTHAPWLLAPWPPMCPCFDGQPPTLWLLTPWPHGPLALCL